MLDDIIMERVGKKSTDKPPAVIVLEAIHINYAGELSLDYLCKLAGLNRTSLNRRFKEKTGRTVMEYLLLHRLTIACDALAHTNLSLNEISEAVGFQYYTHFIKQFTVKIGATPTEYRNNSWDEHDKNQSARL